MSFLKAFTTQINNLIIELYEVLPYNKDIALNKTAIELLISTNPRILYNAFITYVMPYKNQIMERDDAFFLNETKRTESIAAPHRINSTISDDIYRGADGDPKTPGSKFSPWKVRSVRLLNDCHQFL